MKRAKQICLCIRHTAYNFRHAAPQRPRVLSRTFSSGASKGAVGTIRRMSGSRPSTVAVLGALNVAELALKDKGVLSASPRRVGDMENPTFSNSKWPKSGTLVPF